MFKPCLNPCLNPCLGQRAAANLLQWFCRRMLQHISCSSSAPGCCNMFMHLPRERKRKRETNPNTYNIWIQPNVTYVMHPTAFHFGNNCKILPPRWEGPSKQHLRTNKTNAGWTSVDRSTKATLNTYNTWFQTKVTYVMHPTGFHFGNNCRRIWRAQASSI